MKTSIHIKIVIVIFMMLMQSVITVYGEGLVVGNNENIICSDVIKAGVADVLSSQEEDVLSVVQDDTVLADYTDDVSDQVVFKEDLDDILDNSLAYLPEDTKLEKPGTVTEDCTFNNQMEEILGESIELYSASEDTAWQDDFEYTIKGAKIVLRRYIGEGVSVMLPTTATIDGKTYNTVMDSDCSGFFRNKSNLKSIDFGMVTAENLTNMCEMFEGCSNLVSIDLSGFDTSRVVNMSGLFSGCSSLKRLDLTGFDTREVVDMSFMFSGCSSLSTLDIRNFNTIKATTMNSMFCGCSNLSTLYEPNYDTSNVTDMSRMFSGCCKLGSINLSNFNTSNVTDMSEMFFDCKGIYRFTINNFDTLKVRDMSKMFCGCECMTSLSLKIDMANVLRADNMLDNTNLEEIETPRNLSLDIELPLVLYNSNDLNEQYSILPQSFENSILLLRRYKSSNYKVYYSASENKDIITAGQTLEIQTWYKELTSATGTSTVWLHNAETEWSVIDGAQYVDRIETSKDDTHEKIRIITNKNLEAGERKRVRLLCRINDIDSGEYSFFINSVPSASYKAENRSIEYRIPAEINTDIRSGITDEDYNTATVIRDITGVRIKVFLDGVSLGTTKATAQYGSGPQSVIIDSSIIEQIIINLSSKYSRTSDLIFRLYPCNEEGKYNKLVYSDVVLKLYAVSIDGKNTYYGLAGQTFTLTKNYEWLSNGKVDVSKTKKIIVSSDERENQYTTNLEGPGPEIDDYIAKGSFKSVDWWIDENGKLFVKGTGYVDPGWRSDGLPFTPWRGYLDKITSVVVDLTDTDSTELLFCSCSKLVTADLSKLDTSKVTKMNSMFADCSLLKSIDLSGLDTSKVEGMNFMFYKCGSLTILDLSSFDMSKVTDCNYFFDGCDSLETVYAPRNLKYDILLPGNGWKNVSTGESVTSIKKGTAGGTLFKREDNPIIVVTGVTVTPSNKEIALHDSYTLIAKVSPSNASDTSVVWKSENTKVATVDSAGKVTAVSSGTTVITATSSNGKSGSCTITVPEPITTGIIIKADDKTGTAGKTISIPVSISNNTGLGGMALTITSDEALVLTDIERGTLLSTGTFNSDVKTGLVQWYTSNEDVKEDGVLFILKCKIEEGTVAGDYAISISYKDGIKANITDENSVTLDVIFRPGIVSVAKLVKGDATGDGEVAMGDVVKIARAVAGSITLTEDEKAAADVTGDGEVAMGDVVKVARYVAGSIKEL